MPRTHTCSSSAGTHVSTTERALAPGPLTPTRARFVTKELIARGYNVIAFAREQAGIKGKMGKEDTKKVRGGGGRRSGSSSEATQHEIPAARVVADAHSHPTHTQ